MNYFSRITEILTEGSLGEKRYSPNYFKKKGDNK